MGKAQRCLLTLGGLSVVAGAALTFGLAGPAMAQTSTENFAVAAQTTLAPAAQAPKADGMPMPHPHHMRWHHHGACDRRHHHDHDWDHDRWQHDDHHDFWNH